MTSPLENSESEELVDSMETVEFDAEKKRFRAAYDSDRDSTNLAVVSVVAVALDREPGDLPPLHSAVDTDALEELFSEPTAGRSRGGRVSFRYEGFEVTVFSEGTIEADRRAEVSTPG